jgi:hypothetical protein
MAKCSFCGSTVLFGGKKEGDFRFCNEKCRQKGRVLLTARQVPDDIVKEHAREIHTGVCPKCKERRGLVDVYTSHKVWSLILVTSWSSVPQVSCRSCGVKAMLSGTLSSLLLGWWGVPWGVFITPVQIAKNLWGLAHSDESADPSGKLEQIVRINIANQVLARESRPNA